MAELKTKPHSASVRQLLENMSDDQRRQDCLTVLDIMGKITGAEPQMWGESIVGFGTYHYKYASGREGDWFLTGFSPRKQNLTLYLMCGLNQYDDLMAKLGKYKTGKSCLYLKSLADVNLDILKKLIRQSVKDISNAYK